MEKICSECGQLKDQSEYYTQKKSPDGLQYTCKDCTKASKQLRAVQLEASRPVITHAVCNRCNQDLPASEFYPDKRNKNGLMANCKKCRYEHITKKYVTRPDVIELTKQTKHKHRDQYLAEHGIPERKICAICQQQLPIADFYQNDRNKDGYAYQCKKCLCKETVEDKKAPHRRDANNKYNKEYRWWLKTEVFKKYGTTCQCPSGICQESNIKFLTIDHIQNDGKIDRKSPDTFYLRLVNEPIDKTKYRVMCWNCNSGRSKNNGICPHEESQQLVSAEYYT